MNVDKNTAEETDNFNSSIFSQFITELFYTFLPILVLILVDLTFTGDDTFKESSTFWKIILSPEWGFISIVLFGSAIGYLIEIKTKYQKDSSNKIYNGIHLFTILIIVSTIVMLFAFMRQKGVDISPWSIVIFQYPLLFIAIVSVRMAIYYKQAFLNTPKRKNGLMAKEANAFLSYSLSEVNQHLISFSQTASSYKSKYGELIIDKDEMVYLLSRIDKNLSEIREVLQDHTQVSPPDKSLPPTL